MIRTLIPILSLSLVAFLSATCTIKSTWQFIELKTGGDLPVGYEETGPRRAPSPCGNYEAYQPDTNYLDHTAIRYIRINFHWMNSTDGSNNLKEDQARKFTLELYKAINYAMANNKKMYLPHRNNTPCLPTRIQYLLTPDPQKPGDDGIYFHYDDALYFYVTRGRNRNLYDKDVITRYGVQPDSVLNIFMMPHHPDSLASSTYQAYGTGVALGKAMKLAARWLDAKNPWDFRGMLNHETGHIFGLTHTWASNDGCDDTPQHPQKCFGRSAGPGCDTSASNNVMDYNALQLAFSPCQIGKIHQRMSTPGVAQRDLLAPTWHRLDPEKKIVIRDTVAWTGAKDLAGALLIAPGGVLRIDCRVSMPPGSRISVQAGGELILGKTAKLHSDAGNPWRGIEVETVGNRSGNVRMEGLPELNDIIRP